MSGYHYNARVFVIGPLLPPAMRPHVEAVFAYARVARDLATDPALPAAQRLAQLDAWRGRLHAAAAVERSGAAPHAHEDVMVVALAHSIRSLDLPIAWFDDLVSAYGQDTMTTRYDSWADLLDHCRRSVGLLGRLVLRVGGYRDEALDRSSDALCTALELTRRWQQIGPDWIVGRLAVPRDVSAACRARERDLAGPRLDDAWAAALRDCVDRTRAQFEGGRALCDGVAGGLRYERRVVWLGGMRLLDKVEGAGAALPARPPALGNVERALLLWRAARW